MSGWDEFNKLTILSLVFPDNSMAKSATIFGNGKNQVPVLIKIKATDKSGASLNVSQLELAEAISLINYSSGEKLSLNGESSTIPYWNVADESGDYDSPYSYSNSLKIPAQDDNVAQTLKLYVSASDIPANTQTDIAVQIDIPGVGVFNTTADGTGTKNGPGGASGSVFKSPSYLHVSALMPLDYSDTSLLNLIQTSWDPVGGQTYVVHDYVWSSGYWTKENEASLYRSTVKVTPKNSEFKFTHVSSSYKTFYASNAKTGNTTWRKVGDDGFWHEVEDPGITAVNGGGSQESFVAIGGFGKSLNNPNYDAYFWYRPISGSVNTTGHFHLIDSEWQYRTEIDISANTGIGDNEAALCGYKINVPTGANVGAHYWTDAYGPVSFSVTDNFGNTGTFRIVFFHDQSSYVTVGSVRLE